MLFKVKRLAPYKYVREEVYKIESRKAGSKSKEMTELEVEKTEIVK
jgi:hypothetical protein